MLFAAEFNKVHRHQPRAGRAPWRCSSRGIKVPGADLVGCCDLSAWTLTCRQKIRKPAMRPYDGAGQEVARDADAGLPHIPAASPVDVVLGARRGRCSLAVTGAPGT